MKTVTAQFRWFKPLALLGILATANLPLQAADREDVIAGVLIGTAAGYILAEHGGNGRVVHRHDQPYHQPYQHKHHTPRHHHQHVSHCRHSSHFDSRDAYHRSYKQNWSHRRNDHHHRNHHYNKGKISSGKLSGHRGWVIQTRTVR